MDRPTLSFIKHNGDDKTEDFLQGFSVSVMWSRIKVAQGVLWVELTLKCSSFSNLERNITSQHAKWTTIKYNFKYELDKRGLNPGRNNEMLLLQKVSDQRWGPSGLIFSGDWGLKRPWCKATELSPSNAEVQSKWSYTSTPRMPSWRVQGQLYLTVLRGYISRLLTTWQCLTP
jgi:hypothetical protein